MKKVKFKWTFDSAVLAICWKLGWFGRKFGDYYLNHAWSQRFVKFSFVSFFVFWGVKAPLIWFLDLFIGNINLFIIVIPGWLLSTFVSGIILSIMFYLISEGWIWK